MNNFEFLGYEETPNDKYDMLGIATIRMTLQSGSKIVLRYKKVKAKNGGEFICASSFGIEKNGEKKYRQTNKLDSDVENDMLLEAIEEKVKEFQSTRSSQPMAMSSSLGVAQTQGGAATDEQCPF